MRFSDKQISELQAILLEVTGKEYTPEEAQTAGLAIMRFVYVKELRKHQLSNKELPNEN